MIGMHDSILRKHAPLKRWSSLYDAGINAAEITLGNSESLRSEIDKYKRMMIKTLSSKFKIPSLRRAETGHLINCDEAIAGEAECFRRFQRVARGPLRIGINCSRSNDATDVVTIRGAAILALVELCKSRGQRTEIELAYGNGLEIGRTYGQNYLCHTRISLQGCSTDLLTRVCCASETIYAVGHKCVEKTAPSGVWHGVYRVHEFPWKEYDFVLDRLETNDPQVELARVMKQLESFKLL